MKNQKKENPKATKDIFTCGEIYVARESLNQLMQQKFPIRVSYKLAKLAKIFQAELTVFEGLRNALIKESGVVDESGPNKFIIPSHIEERDDKDEVVMVANPNMAKFNEEISELMAQEVKMVVEKVKLPEKVASTCDKCHNNMDKDLEIEPAVLMNLDEFIEV